MLVISLVAVQTGTHRTEQPRIDEQAQIQTPVGDLDNDGDDEPFDRSQCKVYVAGIVAGAIVHQFKTTSNTPAYVMVTNRDEVVRIFENKNIYLWKTRQDFQNTEYTELVQVLPPESVQELNELISIYPYVAMGTEEMARSAQPTLFDSNKCSVD
ncbi:hypothetical protein ACEYW6_11990 [Nostoc sp. UIC 10607]|uniref:hypothetical protein n=1 Tax=Nostoc sp. UIC 10607 TaxID=3045935 RepID=UPI00399F44C7